MAMTSLFLEPAKHLFFKFKKVSIHYILITFHPFPHFLLDPLHTPTSCSFSIKKSKQTNTQKKPQ